MFEICCFLHADRFALLTSCFSILFASRSVLVSRVLLLADCCFLFFIFLIKGLKLFTLMTSNVTPNFTSNGVGLKLWGRNWGQIFQKNSSFCTLSNQPTTDQRPMLDLATGHLRLIISTRCSFKAIFNSLIVFRCSLYATLISIFANRFCYLVAR